MQPILTYLGLAHLNLLYIDYFVRPYVCSFISLYACPYVRYDSWLNAYRFSEHLFKERGEWILRNYSHYSSWAALSCEGPYSITLFEEFTLEEEEKDEEGRKYTYM